MHHMSTTLPELPLRRRPTGRGQQGYCQSRCDGGCRAGIVSSRWHPRRCRCRHRARAQPGCAAHQRTRRPRRPAHCIQRQQQQVQQQGCGWGASSGAGWRGAGGGRDWHRPCLQLGAYEKSVCFPIWFSLRSCCLRPCACMRHDQGGSLCLATVHAGAVETHLRMRSCRCRPKLSSCPALPCVSFVCHALACLPAAARRRASRLVRATRRRMRGTPASSFRA